MDLSTDLKTGFEEDFPEVYRFTLDLTTGVAEETCLLPGRCADFPTIPSHLVGKPHRYCYVAAASKALDSHASVRCAPPCIDPSRQPPLSELTVR